MEQKNLWQNIWAVLNTDLPMPSMPSSGTVKDVVVEGGKAVFNLAKLVKENKLTDKIPSEFGQINSLLDALNSPLGQIVKESLPFLPIASIFLKLIIDKTKQEPDLEMSVALISQVAYLESWRDFLVQHPDIAEKLQDKAASKELAKKIETLGRKLELDGQEITFDAKGTLVCFHQSGLAAAFNTILQSRLQESGLDETSAKITTERVSRQTYRYLKEAVAEVREQMPKLASIYGDGWHRDLENYRSLDEYLKEKIAREPKQPVFDEQFTFEDIYVPLEIKQVKDGEVDEDADAQNIEDWACNWLQHQPNSPNVIFIQGGPGAGKSVFCRMFADRIRRELYPIWIPILIRLRDVEVFKQNFDETLSNAVGYDFVKNDSGWLTDKNTRFVFLLDGFDELLLERGTNQNLQQFLQQVALFQQRASDNKERGHRVIITGRPLALFGIENFMPNNLQRGGIIPMTDSIQTQWLNKWCNVVKADATEATQETQAFQDFLQGQDCPQEVKTLAKEPLLLYLLAALHRDGQITKDKFTHTDANGAKVLIYQQALEWVLEKQRWDKIKGDLTQTLTKLDPEDLRSVLAEAGLCVVQTGNERALVRMIEDRLVAKGDSDAKDLIEKARKAAEENPLKNALAAFYLKAVPGADNSVEFFHKSFGEFLCANRLAESLEEWTEQKGKRRKTTYIVDDAQLHWQVYDLLGFGHLTAEVVDYLMTLLKQNLDEEKWQSLFQRLHDFYLSWCDGEFIEALDPEAEMLPLKKTRQLQKYQIERGQRQVDIYTGLNVLILLLEIHRHAQSQASLKDRIVFYPCGKEGKSDFVGDRLRKIISYSDYLGLQIFGEKVGKFLSGTNLEGANLSSASLPLADLSDANLSNANLYATELFFGNLSGADLSVADLGNTRLEDADLSGADLRGANLDGANLEEADLSGVDLRGANLFRANLEGANLDYANLIGANLDNAHLNGVHLVSAKLIAASLIGADLEDADLEDADLENVKWNDRTNLKGVKGLDTANNVPEGLRQLWESQNI